MKLPGLQNSPYVQAVTRPIKKAGRRFMDSKLMNDTTREVQGQRIMIRGVNHLLVRALYGEQVKRYHRATLSGVLETAVQAQREVPRFLHNAFIDETAAMAARHWRRH